MTKRKSVYRVCCVVCRIEILKAHNSPAALRTIWGIKKAIANKGIGHIAICEDVEHQKKLVELKESLRVLRRSDKEAQLLELSNMYRNLKFLIANGNNPKDVLEVTSLIIRKIQYINKTFRSNISFEGLSASTLKQLVNQARAYTKQAKEDFIYGRVLKEKKLHVVKARVEKIKQESDVIRVLSEDYNAANYIPGDEELPS